MPDTLILDYGPAATRFAARVQTTRQRVEQQGSQLVQTQMQRVRAVIVATTPVDTGALRRSWSAVHQQGNAWAWGISTDLPYASTLEYGGYQRVGPRTVALGGGELGEGFQAGAGIYSRQAPLGWVRRALAQAAPGFRQAVAKLATQAWG